jgi:enterobactin synthetase component D
VGQGRQPLWPPGLVGSITHAGGFALAAVARSSDLAAIGVDSEPLIGTAAGREIVGLVGAAEQATLLGRGGDDRLILTAIFSAKESLFKCLYPLVGVFFEPADAEVVTLSLAAGLFTIRLGRTLSPAFPAGWSAEGRLVVDEARVHTGIALGTGS